MERTAAAKRKEYNVIKIWTISDCYRKMPFGLTWDVGFLRTRSGMLMGAQVVS